MAVRDVTLCICELGWLFTRVSTYLKRIFAGATDAYGLIVQAFGFALQEELQDYYRLLAVLEQEVHRPPVAAQQQAIATQFLVPSQDTDTKFSNKQPRQTPESSPLPIDSSNLTLLRLKAWMQEPLER